MKNDTDEISSACKTYYMMRRCAGTFDSASQTSQPRVCKNFRLASTEKETLLEARQAVLKAEENDSWSATTVDMMSDEEDGTFGGVSVRIVRLPSFRCQELPHLCATLQTRLDAGLKYSATHGSLFR